MFLMMQSTPRGADLCGITNYADVGAGDSESTLWVTRPGPGHVSKLLLQTKCWHTFFSLETFNSMHHTSPVFLP